MSKKKTQVLLDPKTGELSTVATADLVYVGRKALTKLTVEVRALREVAEAARAYELAHAGQRVVIQDAADNQAYRTAAHRLTTALERLDRLREEKEGEGE